MAEEIEAQGGTVALLPKTSDKDAWTPDEAAAVEAAGLVFKFTFGDRKGEKIIAPRPVIQHFLHTVERTGLDPLAKQIYCIGRFGSDGVDWSIQTAIDGFRVIAERSRKYAGQDAAEWMTQDGEWVEVFIKKGPTDHPLAARVKVYRHDWKDDKPAVGVATWEEYAQTKRNGELTEMWQKRGPGQLAKCAEALALRKAFPQDLSGLYTADELKSGSGVVVLEEGPKRAADRSRLPAAAPDPDAHEQVGVIAVDADADPPEGWEERVAAANSRQDLDEIADDARAGGWFWQDVKDALNARLVEIGTRALDAVTSKAGAVYPGEGDRAGDAGTGRAVGGSAKSASRTAAPAKGRPVKDSPQASSEPVTEWPVAEIPKGDEG
jgi:phage recombination protein Bet